MTDILETITGLVGIGSPEAKADAKEGVKAESKGILDKFKSALGKATESKDAGMLAKVKIFFTSLWGELWGVDEEKKEVTAKTQTEVDKAVAEAMGGAQSKIKLAEGTAPDEAASFNEVLAMGVASKASLDSTHEAAANSALAKVETGMKGESAKPLTFEETTTVAAMGLMTLSQLKSKYPDKFAFIKALSKITATSEKSNMPIAKLMDANVVNLFKLDLSDTGNQLQASSLLEKFGMVPFGVELGVGVFGKFGKDTAMAAFGDLKNQPMKQAEATVKFFHENIFVNTDREKVAAALNIISTAVAGGGKLDPLALTDLIFLIDDKDYKKLVTALVGDSNYMALEAGKPGNS